MGKNYDVAFNVGQILELIEVRILFVAMTLVVFSGCSTGNKFGGGSGRTCGATVVNVEEMEAFGFTPPKGKVVVGRVFATWCPYCKEDLSEIGKRFANGTWSTNSVHVMLLAYRNRAESKSTYDKFLREGLPKYGIPSAAIQVVFADKDHKELSSSLGADKKPLLPGWTGIPYGLVFGKDGRLVFRGHFTNSPPIQEAHYQLISDISAETCPSL